MSSAAEAAAAWGCQLSLFERCCRWVHAGAEAELAVLGRGGSTPADTPQPVLSLLAAARPSCACPPVIIHGRMGTFRPHPSLPSNTLLLHSPALDAAPGGQSRT